MALTTTKTIYLNGTSKDTNGLILANFNASFTNNSQINISENIVSQESSDIEEKDFNDFRTLAKTTLKGSDPDE